MTPSTWSTLHARCLDCGTTEHRHYARGRCERCYRRHLYHADPERNRQYTRDYRNRNKEEVNAQDRARYRRKRQQAASMGEGDVVE